jgi:DNA mismatch repair protein MutL
MVLHTADVKTGDIQVLPPQEARRIAAGEVIDRPAALIREFIDNAIDAGASVIEVSIEGGGAKKAEVSDNGSGMDRENLEKCVLPHATSKIRSLDDLDTAQTLGFRGEALAAAAAVARLEIITCANGANGGGGAGGEAWRLEAGPGEDTRVSAASRTRGSTVRAVNLYESIPARKKFLKRDGSEAALCRQIFIDKALAFPEITFRFTQDGRPKDFFPAADSRKERFAAALLAATLTAQEGNFLHEINVSGGGFSVAVVIGGPELFRADRRMLYVFANGRRIQDYSLMNAMEYGTQGWFPNGTHPVGAVFLDIDPALADFNIHPAKREARFKDPGAIHHAISSSLRDFCRHLGLKSVGLKSASLKSSELKSETQEEPNRNLNYDRFINTNDNSNWLARSNPHEGAGMMLAMKAFLDAPPALAPLPGQTRNDTGAEPRPGYAAEDAPVYGEPRYAGGVFGCFILLEWGDKLFIIDQHAAHERILYDRFLSQPIPGQELLVPISFDTESDEDDSFLEVKKEELAGLGIVIEKDGNSWQITALPAGWRLGGAQTVKEILRLREAGENIAERWAATLSCHQAIRDGECLDGASALALAKEALMLPEPRCPHGRPIWTEISREALYKAVRRI